MSMAQPLAGKSAFVTGGGSGVGAVIALHLAQAGAQVTICGRRLEPLQTVAASHSGIRAVVADITDEAAISAAIAQTAPDIVIANAGASESAPFVKTELAAFERMMTVNLTGTFLTLREGARAVILHRPHATVQALLRLHAMPTPPMRSASLRLRQTGRRLRHQTNLWLKAGPLGMVAIIGMDGARPAENASILKP